ncbi:MAG: hypothetical protein JG770_263 [Mahella sp.]|nr:hypothetical protein [Mahella sp.]
MISLYFYKFNKNITNFCIEFLQFFTKVYLNTKAASIGFRHLIAKNLRSI